MFFLHLLYFFLQTLRLFLCPSFITQQLAVLFMIVGYLEWGNNIDACHFLTATVAGALNWAKQLIQFTNLLCDRLSEVEPFR